MIDKLIEILEKLQQDHERIIDGSQVYADIDINTEAKELLKQVKNCNTPDVSVSLVDSKFMKWLAKEAPELCESLYGCMHEYETNER